MVLCSSKVGWIWSIYFGRFLRTFQSLEEAKAYAEDEYRKMHGIENSCYVEEIEWTDYFYQRMMKREAAEQMGIPIRPFTLWNH